MEHKELRAALAEILGVDPEALKSQRFATLVGDSLAALEVSDHVLERTGVQIDLGVLYRSETIEAAIAILSPPDGGPRSEGLGPTATS